ncbi:MAG: TonB family protein [Nodosilinea sp.]
MSLSESCVQQYQQEQSKRRKILLWGVLGSVGVHGVALTLAQYDLWPWLAQAEEVVPIELIVTEPSPEIPPETPPTELSTETNDPAPASVATRSAVAPPPVAQPVEAIPEAPVDIPDPIEPTAAESALEEPKVTETPDPEAEETPEAVATESEETQVDSLQDYLQRLREIQTEAAAPATTAPGTATEAAPEAATAEGSTTTATAPSTGGTGQGQGSRTVACQNCVRPNYPQSALDAGAEGQPMVSVDINPDGSVRSVTLTRSSGNPAIDQAAIEAARSSQFQPVSGGASVPIEYDLTIEGSQRNRDAQRRGERQAVEVPTPAAETAPATAESAPAPASPSPETASETPPKTPLETLLETPTETSAPAAESAPAEETPATAPASPAPADDSPPPELAPDPSPDALFPDIPSPEVPSPAVPAPALPPAPVSLPTPVAPSPAPAAPPTQPVVPPAAPADLPTEAEGDEP